MGYTKQNYISAIQETKWRRHKFVLKHYFWNFKMNNNSSNDIYRVIIANVTYIRHDRCLSIEKCLFPYILRIIILRLFALYCKVIILWKKSFISQDIKCRHVPRAKDDLTTNDLLYTSECHNVSFNITLTNQKVLGWKISYYE